MITRNVQILRSHEKDAIIVRLMVGEVVNEKVNQKLTVFEIDSSNGSFGVLKEMIGYYDEKGLTEINEDKNHLQVLATSYKNVATKFHNENLILRNQLITLATDEVLKDKIKQLESDLKEYKDMYVELLNRKN